MDTEMMTLEQLATYLQRDVREVSKLASRGHLPGHKVSGQWRFARAEINYWLETRLHEYTAEELTALETRAGKGHLQAEPLVTRLLSENTMAVPLAASTRASVLRGLVSLAEQSWQLYDPQAILEAIKQREELGTTALSSGVAIPHPRRPMPTILGESVIAYGRTASGIPFGGPRGGITDIFFLVCCRDHSTHLRVLARLSRILLQPDILDSLRSAATVSETFQVLETAEGDLLQE